MSEPSDGMDERWIAAGCPEPIAADEETGDEDCRFDGCERGADYRVQWDNGLIMFCCQPCSKQNRIYAKENDLLEAEVQV